MFQSTKTYGHEIGLSACFRQFRAKSHCSKLHGYALSVKFVFNSEDDDLCANNWVVDFGGLKSLKQNLQDTFDHKLVVSVNDPHIEKLLELADLGIADVVVLEEVGCEMFAKHAFEIGNQWIIENNLSSRVWLDHVEVREHGANSAIYYGNE